MIRGGEKTTLMRMLAQYGEDCIGMKRKVHQRMERFQSGKNASLMKTTMGSRHHVFVCTQKHPSLMALDIHGTNLPIFVGCQ